MPPQSFCQALKRISDGLQQIAALPTSNVLRQPRESSKGEVHNAIMASTHFHLNVSELSKYVRDALEQVWDIKQSPQLEATATSMGISLDIIPRAAALQMQILAAREHPGGNVGNEAAGINPAHSPNAASTSPTTTTAPTSRTAPTRPTTTAGLSPEAIQATQLHEQLDAIFLSSALQGLLMLCIILGAPSKVQSTGGPAAASATLAANRPRLYEQVCDIAVGRCMAAAVRLVEREGWPNAKEHIERASTAAAAAAQGHDGGSGRGRSKSSRAPASRRAAAASSGPLSQEIAERQQDLYELSCSLMQLVTESLQRLMKWGIADAQTVTSVTDGVVTGRQQQPWGLPQHLLLQLQQPLLRMLLRSGVIAATCSALNAASPLWRYAAEGAAGAAGAAASPSAATATVSGGGGGRPNRILVVLEALYYACTSMIGCLDDTGDLLQLSDDEEDCREVLEILAAPEVVGLQRLLLERVVADSGGDDDGGGGGGGSDARPSIAAEKVVPTLICNERLTLSHARIVSVVFQCWSRVEQCPRLRPMVPAAPERVRLSLRLARALHRLTCGRGVGGHYHVTGSSAASASSSSSSSSAAAVVQLLDLTISLEGLMLGVRGAAASSAEDTCMSVEELLEASFEAPSFEVSEVSFEESSEVPEAEVPAVLDAKEACAWALAVVNDVQQRGWAMGDAERQQLHTRLPTFTLRTLAADPIASRLPADARRTLALRLVRTGLMHNLDARLRHTVHAMFGAAAAATTAAGAEHRAYEAVLESVLFNTYLLLKPLLQEMLRQSCRGQLGAEETEETNSRSESGARTGKAVVDSGSGDEHSQGDNRDADPWVTKRELGLFITVSKLALRTAADLSSSQEEAAAVRQSGSNAVAPERARPPPSTSGARARMLARMLTLQMDAGIGLLVGWRRQRALPPGPRAAAGLTEALTLAARAA
ncbi:hypothetical protein Agub_g2471, partial [Astrephomene gubernaculifera]